MRRLGFLIPEFPQQTHVAWWRICTAMREAGIFCQFLSTRTSREPCPHVSLSEEAKSTVYLWPPKLTDLKVFIFAIRSTEKLFKFWYSLEPKEGFSKLHFFAHIAAALRLLRVSRLHRLEHIFIHSCGDAAYVAALCRIMGGPSYSLRLGGDLEVYGTDHRLKMKNATLIVAAARDHRQSVIEKIGIDAEKVIWTWVGTDTRYFCPASDRRDPAIAQIITVARLNHSKGYQILIPALAELIRNKIDFRYVIVGEGPFRSDLEELVATYRLESRVSFAGSLDHSEILRILQMSDVFVLPTSGIGEGTPAAVCEAMSVGLPVVATLVGGMSDMITDGEDGLLVPPGAVHKLAQAIGVLISNRQTRSYISGNARSKAIEEFDYRNVARKILEHVAKIDGAQQ